MTKISLPEKKSIIDRVEPQIPELNLNPSSTEDQGASISKRIKDVLAKLAFDEVDFQEDRKLHTSSRIDLLCIENGLNVLEATNPHRVMIDKRVVREIINPNRHILVRHFHVEAFKQTISRPSDERIIADFMVNWNVAKKTGMFFNKLDFFLLSVTQGRNFRSYDSRYDQKEIVSVLHYLILKHDPDHLVCEKEIRKEYDDIITWAIKNDHYELIFRLQDEIKSSGKNFYTFACKNERTLTGRYIEYLHEDIGLPAKTKPLPIDPEIFRERTIGKRF